MDSAGGAEAPKAPPPPLDPPLVSWVDFHFIGNPKDRGLFNIGIFVDYKILTVESKRFH